MCNSIMGISLSFNYVHIPVTGISISLTMYDPHVRDLLQQLTIMCKPVVGISLSLAMLTNIVSTLTMTKT